MTSEGRSAGSSLYVELKATGSLHNTSPTTRSTALRFGLRLAGPANLSNHGCDTLSTFEETYLPLTLSGALQLKATLAELLAQPGARRPDRVRFFRTQMQTIITRALAELNIKALPSRRCFNLLGALLLAKLHPPRLHLSQLSARPSS